MMSAEWVGPAMPKLDRFRIATARRLRSTMTDEERILWHHLWRIPVEGTHFRKQAPIGRFIVDFVSHRLKLAIELDGSHHSHGPQMQHDADRDRWLKSEGYSMLRFWNHEVKKGTGFGAGYDLCRRARTERPPPPRWGRSPQGGGWGCAEPSHPTPALTRRPSPFRGG
ncbi:endonuclease domain-containing protein [Aquibium carbonis]|uniref:endonuclease domain-containing protein n=1 Tax=Aquibium carbonis TaxID=2495581 RepID=UPI003CCB4ED8